MALTPGTKLGPYEILAPLGAGGMGEVWRARDTRLGREVAIKVLPDAVSNDPKALARFESEAKAVAALSHPNILSLFDVGEAGGVHYAVTELLEGETLRALVARGPVPVKRALEIAEQIARGPRRRPREGDRPPRRQARERLPHQRRQRQAPRLRPRAAGAQVAPFRGHPLLRR